jgi:predicted component of type VI protein secretion system
VFASLAVPVALRAMASTELAPQRPFSHTVHQMLRMQEGEPKPSTKRSSKVPMPKSFLDCFTGRYLYQVYGAWREEAQRQHVLALARDHEHNS